MSDIKKINDILSNMKKINDIYSNCSSLTYNFNKTIEITNDFQRLINGYININSDSIESIVKTYKDSSSIPYKIIDWAESMNELIYSTTVNSTYVSEYMSNMIYDVSSILDDIPIDESENLSSIENVKKNLIDIKTDKINYKEWIVVIFTVLSAVFCILSYYKPNSDEEKVLQVLEKINYNIEKGIELESTAEPVK